jgi:hypothetical protein
MSQKNIIHKNVGTKGNSKNDTEKNVCRVNHDSYRYPSLSPMLYDLCICLSLFLSGLLCTLLTSSPYRLMYVKGLHVRPAAVCRFYAAMDEHHLHLLGDLFGVDVNYYFDNLGDWGYPIECSTAPIPQSQNVWHHLWTIPNPTSSSHQELKDFLQKQNLLVKFHAFDKNS